MCSHIFGSHGLGGFLGDALGIIGGGILGSIVPGIGTALGATIGGGLGGFAGTAASGGKLGQDFLGALGGAAGGFGLGSGAEALGLGSSLGGAAAGSTADVASGAASAGGTTALAGPTAGAIPQDITTLFADQSAAGPALTAGGTVAPGAAGGADAIGSAATGGTAAAAGGGAEGGAFGFNAPQAGGFWSSIGNFLTPSSGSFSSYLPAAVAGVGLAKNLMANPNQIEGTSQLQGQAQQLAASANVYSNYLQTGTLPPGAQQAIDQATQSAISNVKAKFASNGQAGSTQEAQEIATLQQNAAVGAGQVATQLLGQGLQMGNLSNGIYQFLVGEGQKTNDQTNSAIANLSAAIAGGYRIPGNSNGSGGSVILPAA